MHWIKYRVFECEWHDPAYGDAVCRVHCRLRSDGSMWYQVARRHGPYDLCPELLEGRFLEFLSSDLPPRVRSGWNEQDFDEDFLDRLQQMNGKEITSAGKEVVA